MSMAHRPWRTILSPWLLFAAALVPDALAAPAECTADGFKWSYNAQGQSPCAVASALNEVCGDAAWGTLPPGALMFGGPTKQDDCQCNLVHYNLLRVCAMCQGNPTNNINIENFKNWAVHCNSQTVVNFPKPLPGGTSIPGWANKGDANGDFDFDAAKGAGSPPPVSSAASSAAPASKAPPAPTTQHPTSVAQVHISQPQVVKSSANAPLSITSASTSFSSSSKSAPALTSSSSFSSSSSSSSSSVRTTTEADKTALEGTSTTLENDKDSSTTRTRQQSSATETDSSLVSTSTQPDSASQTSTSIGDDDDNEGRTTLSDGAAITTEMADGSVVTAADGSLPFQTLPSDATKTTTSTSNATSTKSATSTTDKNGAPMPSLTGGFDLLHPGDPLPSEVVAALPEEAKHIATIAGGVCGAVAAIGILAGLGFWYRRKQVRGDGESFIQMPEKEQDEFRGIPPVQEASSLINPFAKLGAVGNQILAKVRRPKTIMSFFGAARESSMPPLPPVPQQFIDENEIPAAANTANYLTDADHAHEELYFDEDAHVPADAREMHAASYYSDAAANGSIYPRDLEDDAQSRYVYDEDAQSQFPPQSFLASDPYAGGNSAYGASYASQEFPPPPDSGIPIHFTLSRNAGPLKGFQPPSGRASVATTVMRKKDWI